MRKGLEHLYRNKPIFFFFLVGEEGVRKLVRRDRQIFDQKKPITMVHKHTYSFFFLAGGGGGQVRKLVPRNRQIFYWKGLRTLVHEHTYSFFWKRN